MLEFVFFDPRPRQRFVEFLMAREVPVTELEDDETFGVGIPEDVDDGLMEAIEACYDELMAFDQQLFEAGSEGADAQAAGVVLNLASGDTVYARVDPMLLGRIMEVLTPQELGEVVNAIVDAVENPDANPLCHTPDDEGG
ncbi:MAG: hypothetical protein WBM71_09170 [Sedimenticolaceae bacterium]